MFSQLLSFFLSVLKQKKNQNPADCCFSGCSDSHRRHADSDWHPGYFHKWIELSQMICHSSSRSLTVLALVWFCVSAHGLDTHTRNYARPNCHLPPRLSGSSQPRSPCSASWGVFAGWGRGLSDRLLLPQKGTGWRRTRAPAGPSGSQLVSPFLTLTRDSLQGFSHVADRPRLYPHTDNIIKSLPNVLLYY